jgi:carbon storage regulator
MLVLSRKLHETILIGNDVKITVVKLSGDKVGIGIEAPRDVRIKRSELPTTNPET